jgi:hypothetical protein
VFFLLGFVAIEITQFGGKDADWLHGAWRFFRDSCTLQSFDTLDARICLLVEARILKSTSIPCPLHQKFPYFIAVL